MPKSLMTASNGVAERLFCYVPRSSSLSWLDSDCQAVICDDVTFKQQHSGLKKILPTIAASTCSLDICGQLLPALTTRCLGQTILYNPSLRSTQILASSRFAPIVPEGTLCIADVQTEGCGRGSNGWSSPVGSLSFSFASSFYDPCQLPFVQYLVSLALVRVIHHLRLPSSSLPSSSSFSPSVVRIKWPNDLYGAGLKVGGILCQSAYQNGHYWVTTGVGINLANTMPTTSIAQLLGQPISREAFMSTFCNIFEPMQHRFHASGFKPFQEEYLAHWLHSDQQVTIQHDDGTVDDAHLVTIKGLTSSGCLLATDATGLAYELYPDGNSLDFFTGLLKRKI